MAQIYHEIGEKQYYYRSYFRQEYTSIFYFLPSHKLTTPFPLHPLTNQ